MFISAKVSFTVRGFKSGEGSELGKEGEGSNQEEKSSLIRIISKCSWPLGWRGEYYRPIIWLTLKCYSFNFHLAVQ